MAAGRLGGAPQARGHESPALGSRDSWDTGAYLGLWVPQEGGEKPLITSSTAGPSWRQFPGPRGQLHFWKPLIPLVPSFPDGAPQQLPANESSRIRDLCSSKKLPAAARRILREMANSALWWPLSTPLSPKADSGRASGWTLVCEGLLSVVRPA